MTVLHDSKTCYAIMVPRYTYAHRTSQFVDLLVCGVLLCLFLGLKLKWRVMRIISTKTQGCERKPHRTCIALTLKDSKNMKSGEDLVFLLLHLNKRSISPPLYPLQHRPAADPSYPKRYLIFKITWQSKPRSGAKRRGVSLFGTQNTDKGSVFHVICRLGGCIAHEDFGRFVFRHTGL
ncbi:hypothetical protein E1B28_006879 [Marasmius oreades]|uniref:Uncharacterized protein n=1 Tax=Marasmius oreades TaxID=181124 RepID=A0A9P7S165_9AGAR|nr:uncharacterized protein E1B28_006879 [Marasmius oreades]KAG7093190.1 hypothetical protein E1B28_006879 [Marasmius oreades]